jgi:hypothetical protein
MLRPGVRLDQLLELTEHAIRRCVEAGVRPVLLSGADPTEQLPLGRVVHRRAAYLTAGLAEVCARHGVTLVNCFADQEIRNARYWSVDRLHLNSRGHERVAGLVLHALGFAETPPPAASDAAADVVLDAVSDAASNAASAPGNARYYREHVLPWINRRLRGRSSGDNREPKHPHWQLVSPPGTTPATAGSQLAAE